MDYIGIIALVISAAAFITSIYTYISNTKHDRKCDTLEAYNRLQKDVFDKLNLYSPKDIEEIAKHPTSEEFKIVSGYIAQIEHFCVGMNHRIYDKDVLYDLAHGFFDSDVLLKRIFPIIDRKKRNGVDYYENTHKVIEWMNSKSRLLK